MSLLPKGAAAPQRQRSPQVRRRPVTNSGAARLTPRGVQRHSPRRLNRSLSLDDLGMIVAVIAGSLWMLFNEDVSRLGWLIFTVSGCLGIAGKVLLGPCLRLGYLSLPAAFYSAYFVLMAMSSIFVYAEMSDGIRDSYLLGIQSVLVTFPLGVLLATLLFHDAGKRVRAYALGRLEVTPNDVRFSSVIFLIFWAAVGVAGVYIAISEFIPILKLVFDYSSQIDDISLRFAVTELPRPLLFALALSRSLALPLCTLYLYFMAQAGGMQWRRDLLLVFSVSVGIAVLSLERAPLMALSGMLLFGIAIANMQRPFGPKALRSYGMVLVFAFTLAGFISACQYDSEVSTTEVTDGMHHVLVNRILLASARTASMAFDAFPTSSDQLHGQYIRMFTLITGKPYLESRYAPRLVILPVSFVGDLWRNWGWPAVLLGGIAIGVISQTVQLLLFSRKTVISSVFHAILILAFIWLIPGNAFGIVTTSLLVLSTSMGWLAIRFSLKQPTKRLSSRRQRGSSQSRALCQTSLNTSLNVGSSRP